MKLYRKKKTDVDVEGHDIHVIYYMYNVYICSYICIIHIPGVAGPLPNGGY